MTVMKPLGAHAPEQILFGPPASWRVIWPLLSRISFWYCLIRIPITAGGKVRRSAGVGQNGAAVFRR
ncbi:MAG: hypothetical protein QOJ04_3585 [Caballeronia sp.]|jgi:hypothetical protein|nr:hypothetical protein [Caballeronia sp.]MEA3114530.1 hypothetical protein [Caballeronia sp.]